MTTPEQGSPDVEEKHHRYITNRIPWYVHLIWISFWLFSVAYVVRFLFPAIQKELLSPP
jgi:hypothetical protein